MILAAGKHPGEIPLTREGETFHAHIKLGRRLLWLVSQLAGVTIHVLTPHPPPPNASYTRWRPLYDVIKIVARVKFVYGLPENCEKKIAILIPESETFSCWPTVRTAITCAVQQGRICDVVAEDVGLSQTACNGLRKLYTNRTDKTVVDLKSTTP